MKITAQQVNDWLGDDVDREEIIRYLIAVLNEEISLDQSRKEITEYNE